MLGWLNAFLYFRCQPLWRVGARYRCPLVWKTSARDCFNRGECGCDNADRFR